MATSMNKLGTVARDAAAILLCTGLCLEPIPALAATDDDVAELKRALE